MLIVQMYHCISPLPIDFNRAVSHSPYPMALSAHDTNPEWKVVADHKIPPVRNGRISTPGCTTKYAMELNYGSIVFIGKASGTKRAVVVASSSSSSPPPPSAIAS